MIIDSHCHIYFDKFVDDLDEVVRRAEAAGVKKMINIGCDLETSVKAAQMGERFESVYSTVGLHPCYCGDVGAEIFEDFERMIVENEKIVAVGECGLDYYKGDTSEEGKATQRFAFESQIELATKTHLPLVIHNREADEECFAILSGAGTRNVVFHCYGSDLKFAEKVWRKGWITSFTGIVTYPNAKDLQEVARNVPMDLFMVETDCPFLAPQGHRGERNEPAYVTEVVEKIAELKGLPVDEVAKVATDNTKRFFPRLV